MALTAATTREFEGEIELHEAACAGNDIFYRGALLMYDSNGYAAVPSDSADLYFAGMYTGKAADGVSDYAYSVAASTYPKLQLAIGKIWVAFSGAAQSDVGELFYVSDDNTLTQTAGSKNIAYLCVGYKSGYVLIDFRHPIK